MLRARLPLPAGLAAAGRGRGVPACSARARVAQCGRHGAAPQRLTATAGRGYRRLPRGVPAPLQPRHPGVSALWGRGRAAPGGSGPVRSGPFRSSHPFVPPCRGRVAFITGGGSGIGFRIAEIFMRYGAARAGPCEGSAGRSHRPSVAGTAVGPPSPAGTNSAWPR